MATSVVLARGTSGHDLLVGGAPGSAVAATIERKATTPPPVPARVTSPPPPPQRLVSAPSLRGPAAPPRPAPTPSGPGPSHSPVVTSLFERNLGPPRDSDQLGIDMLANESKKIDSDSETASQGTFMDRDQDTIGGDDEPDTFDRMFSDQQPESHSRHMNGGAPPEEELSYEQVQQQKAWILSQLKRLEKHGVVSPRRFTMDSSLTEMKTEIRRLKQEISLDRNLNFCRQGVLFFTKMIELINCAWDPFDLKLDGWSQAMMTEVHGYDEIFEELLEKWGGRVDMGPELKLIGFICISGFTFYINKSLVEDMSNPNGNSRLMGKLGSVLGKLVNLGGLGGSGMGSSSNAGAPTGRAPGTPLRREMRGPSVTTDELMASLGLGGADSRRRDFDSESDISSYAGETITVPASTTKPKRRGRPPKVRV